MKTRAALVLAAVGGVAGAAYALPPSQFTATSATPAVGPIGMNYIWSFTEVQASSPFGPGNGNGRIDAGEGALINLKLVIDHNNNTTLTYASTTLGGTGTGTLRGIGSAFFDLLGSGGSAGTFNVIGPTQVNGAGQSAQSWGSFRQWQLNAGGAPTNPDDWKLFSWDSLNIGNGVQNANGAGETRLDNVQTYQVPLGVADIRPGVTLVDAYRVLWVPTNTTTGRTVHWTPQNGSANGGTAAAVNTGSTGYARDGTGGATSSANLVIGGQLSSAFSGLDIPVGPVPTPSSLALLGLGGLIAARRRR